MTAERLLDELTDPACFPETCFLGASASVEVIQTHLSVVCIAGDRAYKLKKSRRLPFVDFTSLAQRRQACRDEVRLNRRLCPRVYLGSAALRRTAAGLRFAQLGDDEGDADLDVAVVMQRLPADRMLDVLLAAGTVTRSEIEALAELVAVFHAGADRGAEVIAAGAPQRLAGYADANFDELATIPGHDLPSELMQVMRRRTAVDFGRLLPLLERRAATHIVDGHGDLHARNICMTRPPSIYDCIEFEPTFRCGDVATENAFFVMDLRYRGAAGLARDYVAAYVAVSGDRELMAMLPVLCAYRAMVRAKVSALAAAEPELSATDRAGARDSARRHLLLAASLTLEGGEPRWLVACGPPASGKTALCQRLQAIAEWPYVATDIVRKELAGLRPTDRGGAPIYTPEFSARTYAEVARRAAAATAAGAPVVLVDGNMPTPEHRAAVIAAARRAGAVPQLLHVDVDDVTAAERARRRSAEATDASDAGPDVAARLHALFVTPTLDETAFIVRLDGTRPVAANAAVALARLLPVAAAPPP